MREDLKRIVDQLNEEDLYLLYVTALEMIRDYPEERHRGQGTARGSTNKGGNLWETS